MPTVTVNTDVDVDIDLDDFDFDDIVGFVIDNIDDISIRRKKELRQVIDMNDNQGIEVNSIYDKLKYECIEKIFQKYTLEQLETLLPE